MKRASWLEKEGVKLEERMPVWQKSLELEQHLIYRLLSQQRTLELQNTSLSSTYQLDILGWNEAFVLAAVVCEPLRGCRAYVCEKMRMWEMEIKSGEATVCTCALWYTVAQGRWIQLFKHIPWLSSYNCLSSKQEREPCQRKCDRLFLSRFILQRFKR